jgi:4-phospho-D-threonate 3-dehydrogenase / 4-phospho-D-erythronate 3-dehydrogenase
LAKQNERKAVLAITMGDAAGIGPEIILKTLAHPDLFVDSRVLILGDLRVLKEYGSTIAETIPELIPLKSPTEIMELPMGVPCVYNPNKDRLKYTPGQPDAATGKASLLYLEQATQLAMTSRASAIVTAPISKRALQAAGYLYTGHTDYLAEATNARKVYMTIYSKKLTVLSVTGHTSLRRVHSQIKQAKIIRAATLLDQFMSALRNKKRPVIAVTGLNPHAGEGGILGREELFEIVPAVQAMQGMNFSIVGPLAADVAFMQAYDGLFDAVIAMYHDQAIIPIKLTARFDACQISLGLPIIRTSVNHGTAEDIAGKGKANPDSMIEAIRLALKLINLRNKGHQV